MGGWVDRGEYREPPSLSQEGRVPVITLVFSMSRSKGMVCFSPVSPEAWRDRSLSCSNGFARRATCLLSETRSGRPADSLKTSKPRSHLKVKEKTPEDRRQAQHHKGPFGPEKNQLIIGPVTSRQIFLVNVTPNENTATSP